MTQPRLQVWSVALTLQSSHSHLHSEHVNTSVVLEAALYAGSALEQEQEEPEMMARTPRIMKMIPTTSNTIVRPDSKPRQNILQLADVVYPKPWEDMQLKRLDGRKMGPLKTRNDFSAKVDVHGLRYCVPLSPLPEESMESISILQRTALGDVHA